MTWNDKNSTSENTECVIKLHVGLTTKSGQDLDMNHTGFKTQGSSLLTVNAVNMTTKDCDLACQAENPRTRQIYNFFVSFSIPRHRSTTRKRPSHNSGHVCA